MIKTPEENGESSSLMPLAQLAVPAVVAVFSYPRTGTSLVESIRKYGIINPVIVTPAAPGTGSALSVVCGAKRHYAAQELGMKDIPVKILPGKPLSEREIFDLAFTDNVTVRKLNVIECAGVLSVVSGLLRGTDSEEIEHYLSLLELKNSSHSIDIYRGINDLEDAIKTYVVQWNISAGHAARLVMFHEDDRQSLFAVIKVLQLHGGKFKQFVELIFEICKRDRKNVEEIINEPEAASILHSTKITVSQKQAKILDVLHTRRYPQLTERMRRFVSIAASIKNIHAGVFTPPHNFEGDTIRASISFKTLEELDTLCAAVQDGTNRDKIQTLLNLL